MFENRVLRKIFQSEMEEVTGQCIKLCGEELKNLYCIKQGR
jgi:hypothetical protein